MAILIVVSTLSVIVAWWRERAGGIMLAVCAVAQGVFAYLASGHNRGFAVLIAGGPYLLISILFLLSWRGRERGQPGGSRRNAAVASSDVTPEGPT